MPVKPNGFVLRRPPASYPSNTNPPLPLGTRWRTPAVPGALRSEGVPHAVLYCQLASTAGMVATVAVPPVLQQMVAHLTSTASIAAKMASPIKSLLTSTANIAATMRAGMRCVLSSTVNIAATVANPNNGNDSFTTALLHFNGVNGASSFPDVNVGGSAKTWVRSGVTSDLALISTAQSKFGGASAHIASMPDFTVENPGAGRAAIWTPDSADWHMGTADFTIDFWFKRVWFNEDERLHPGNQSLFWWNRLAVVLADDFVNPFLSTYFTIDGQFHCLDNVTEVVDGNWHHVAMGRWEGTNIGLFYDGVLESQDAVSASGVLTVPGIPKAFVIGNDDGGTSDGTGTHGQSQFAGYIDEFRISKGIARWTSDFTPPTGPYG